MRTKLSNEIENERFADDEEASDDESDCDQTEIPGESWFSIDSSI